MLNKKAIEHSALRRILITGANGQLGTEIQTIISAGRSDIGTIPIAYEQASIIATDADTLDITDAAAVLAFVTDAQPDLIINCAAFTNVDACESEPEKALLLNATAAGHLADAASAIDAKLVHVSTDYVFSGEAKTPRIESDPTSPRSVYGTTKLAGEQEVKTRCAKHFIVRTAWLYGSIGNNFVKTMLRLARENGIIKVVADQFGNPTNANDLAHVLLKLALTELYGTYHCTGNGICSWFDFASAIVDGAKIDCEKIPCTTAEFLRPAPRPHFSALDNARLRATIGDDMRTWQEALAMYLSKL